MNGKLKIFPKNATSFRACPELDSGTGCNWVYLMSYKLKVLFFLICFIVYGCDRISTKELQRAVDPLNEGNPPLAISKLEELKKRHPHNPRLLYYLSLAYLRNNQEDWAFENVGEALRLKPNFKHVVGDVEMANFLAGNSEDVEDPMFKTAIRELQKIIKENKGTEVSDEIQFHLGTLFLKKKDYKNAIREFQLVVDTPPVTNFDREAMLFIGDTYADILEDTEKGIKVYEKVIRDYPKSESAERSLYRIGITLTKKMEMYKKRHDALKNFYSSWDGIKEFEDDRRLAKEQSVEDLKISHELKKKAIDSFESLLKDFPQGRFHEKAKVYLNEMGSQS
ncbi:MAG: outer membrane protein assembly factor BamD [Nitrospinae bacterium]|nr:outer membrane protein assembly factor BamD [Nitrospinota bacterium]